MFFSVRVRDPLTIGFSSAAKVSWQRRSSGFLGLAEGKRGRGVVTLDGETRWIDSPSVRIPHPILILELDDFREFATEAQIEQSISQLYRETWSKPDKLDPDALSIDSLAG